MIRTILATLFGGGRNAATEIIETFRPNAERSAQRAADAQTAAMAQFAAEFAQPRGGLFDRFVDGLNRLPRPIMALGTIGFFGLLVHDPIAFASRMQPLELVPAELWWLIGAVVSFYFGARELQKFRERGPRLSAEDVTGVIDKMKQIEALRPEEPDATNAPGPATEAAPGATTGNAAIDAWREGRG